MRNSILLLPAHSISMPQAMGAIVLSCGLTVFLSWALGLGSSIWIFASVLRMKANTSVAVSLLAIGLLIINRRMPPNRHRNALLACLMCLFLGAASLAQYFFKFDLGIDQIVSLDKSSTVFPGRMSPVTAVAVTMLALAQILACAPQRHRVLASQFLCIAVMVISTVTLFAYLYNASSLLYVAHYVPMAFSTACAIQLLALGSLALHSDTGLMAPLSSKTMTARMGRRVLISVWIALPALAWVRSQGQARNLFGPEFGVALLVTVGLAMMSALIMWHTSTAEKGERRAQYLNRIYSVLSEVNALIVRVVDRTQLFNEASLIAVQRGGFPRAWFGLVNIEKNVVELVARQDSVHLHKTPAELAERLSLEQGSAGFSPIARAVRSGYPVISNDVVNDKEDPFSHELLADGIFSYAIFPLSLGGKIVGIFKLHAEVPNFFHADEIRLLSDMAGDITFAINNLEQRRLLDHLAYFDSLTGLANARLFEERLYQAIDTATRHRSELAVIVFDVIAFRLINEVHGRQAGDQTLQVLAQRLAACCGDTGSGRLGSNLFAVFFAGVATEARIVSEYERIMTCCFGEAFLLMGNRFALTARSGIAILHNDGDNAKTLLNNAEAALRSAHASGHLYRFYNPASNDRNVARLGLQVLLTQALAESEFALHYQIKVDCQTMLPCGAEALLRWHSAELGQVPPSTFVPILEEIGLIGKVGAWALQQASLDSTHAIMPASPGFRIAVNVSASQLLETDFVEKVQAAFGEFAHMAEIDLELTESLVMSDIEASIDKLRRLRAIGLKIAIDDFGTGYSSMAYLAKLPLDYLKIDRAFVMGLPNDTESLTVISSIISLGHALGLRVIAEGIEHASQAALLVSLGCDELQGYYFGRPEPLPALLSRLENRIPAMVSAVIPASADTGHGGTS